MPHLSHNSTHQGNYYFFFLIATSCIRVNRVKNYCFGKKLCKGSNNTFSVISLSWLCQFYSYVISAELLNLINKQKLSYFGHIKRQNTLEKLFLEGTCEGRRGRGRPRRRWTQEIGEWMGVSTVEAGRQALERGEFRHAVWEATSIKDPP